MGDFKDDLLSVTSNAYRDGHLSVTFGINECHHLVGMGSATPRIEGRQRAEQGRMLFVEPFHYRRQDIINLIAFLVHGITVGMHPILPCRVQKHFLMIRANTRLVLHMRHTYLLGMLTILRFGVPRFGADLNLKALHSVGWITVAVVEFANHIEENRCCHSSASQPRTALAIVT